MLPFGINELPHFQAEDPLKAKRASITVSATLLPSV
jgi:hypothetical protein